MEQKVTVWYRYVLYNGNNPNLIQQSLSRRGVWQQIACEKWLLANLIWKPYNFSGNIYTDIEQVLRNDRNRNIFLNHFESNTLITTKSGLVNSLKYYYSHQTGIYHQNYHLFQTMPTTFVVKANKQSSELKAFYNRFHQIQKNNYEREKMPVKHCEANVWYVKPEAENQGKGIALFQNLKQLDTFIFSKTINTNWVIQKAVEKPLLYFNRKFDIRVWIVVTQNFDIYYYNSPYLRTSSSTYNLKILKPEVHLTNNSQQKKLDEYSKFEEGNILPLQKLKEGVYMDEQFTGDLDDIVDCITNRMKQLVLDTIYSVRRMFCRNMKKRQFEIFGFDFLVDQDFRTWLIEVNNNPCFNSPNSFMKSILPKMIDEMFQLVLDPYFTPSGYIPVTEKCFQLLHKQISLYRMSQWRAGSTECKKKQYYPMKQQTRISSTQKIRRKSQVQTTLSSLQSQNIEKNNSNRIRYLTPIQTIKTLLENYCFTDLDRYQTPVYLVLSSQRMMEKQSIEANIKNLKLITESRVCGILLEQKFLQICKNLIKSQSIENELKDLIILGYAQALRTNKHKQSIIKIILSQIIDILLRQMLVQTKKIPFLICSTLSLLIKLGGIVNRKIFIPGQSRQNEAGRQLFIRSNCFNIFIYLKEKYPSVLVNEVKQFMSNFEEKDYQLLSIISKQSQFDKINISQTYKGIESNNSYNQAIMSGKFVVLKNAAILQGKRKTSLRDRIQTRNVQSFAKNGNILPKIK